MKYANIKRMIAGRCAVANCQRAAHTSKLMLEIFTGMISLAITYKKSTSPRPIESIPSGPLKNKGVAQYNDDC